MASTTHAAAPDVQEMADRDAVYQHAFEGRPLGEEKVSGTFSALYVRFSPSAPPTALRGHASNSPSTRRVPCPPLSVGMS